MFIIIDMLTIILVNGIIKVNIC